MKAAVYGLGKLGKPLAEFMQYRGISTIGVDVDPAKLKSDKIETTNDFKYAVKNTDISVIFVNTPNLEDGAFNLKYVHQVAESIANELKFKKKYHLIALRSTVLPGATEDIIDQIERISGKKCGKDFGMVHSPEFLALGEEIENIRNPEYVLIGEYDRKSGDLYSGLCKKIMENNAPIVRTSLKDAELAKLLANNYITMKLNFANLIGEICDKAGTDPDQISDILGRDSRIGRKFLTAGLSYGGTCFPRDNVALAYYLDRIGMEVNFPKMLENMNNRQVERIANKIKDPKKVIAVLGTSFKPGTDVVVESASIKLINILKERGATIKVHDVSALDNTRAVLKDNVTYHESLEDCVQGSDIVIIANPTKEYKQMKRSLLKDKEVLDCWRILK